MFVGTYSATKIEADDKYRLLGGNDGTVAPLETISYLFLSMARSIAEVEE